jgi:S1-C subfamily serine protease
VTWRWVVVLAVIVAAGGGLVSVGAAGPSGRPAPLTAPELETVRAAARAAVVEVSAVGCRARTSGSGFRVDDVVVTNRHVVDGAVVVEVRAASGRRSGLDVEAHPVLDLARIPDHTGPALELARERPGPGTPVVLAGHPDGGPLRLVSTRVHLWGEGGTWGLAGEVLLFDTVIGPGWSGGPVLDRQGRVVAVLVAQDTRTGLSIAIPVDGEHSWLTSPVSPVSVRCEPGTS